MTNRLFQLWILWICSSSLAIAQVPTFPMVESVERQPLLSQVHRLKAAMDNLGSPLEASLERSLNELAVVSDDSVLTRRIQELLDSRCIAAITLSSDSPPVVQSRESLVELDEQGWRVYLVKVINPDRLRSPLRVDSPNAKPLPHAKSVEIDSRWLGVSMIDNQPMTPGLTGLPLEYRLIELYAKEPGIKSVELAFAAPGGTPLSKSRPSDSVFAQWRFDQDASGWEPKNDIQLSVDQGALLVRGVGDDPFMQVTLPENLSPGNFVLRIWGQSEESGIGQVFWWSDQRPLPDGDHVVGFNIEPGRQMLYEIPFSESDRLAGVRIDPNGSPCHWRIDWIELSNADAGKDWGSSKFNLNVRPSQKITFNVNDEPDRPAMGCFEITDSSGRVYPPQNKRLAPDLFFQRQIYRGQGESVRLPRGQYKVKCSRGPESITEFKTLVVEDSPVELFYNVQRWIDPSRHGYWSGDHHIHAAGCAHYENPTQGVRPEDMLRHCMGEDLKVGCCLTWGPCFDYQKQFFSGQLDSNSRYPYLIRYDIEVSGFGSHASGHLNLLRLKEQIPEGGQSKDHWPTLGLNTLRWAKKQGAVCGPAHSSIGLTRFVDRVPQTDGLDGPGGLPHFNIPAFDGIGANEFIMNVAHNVEGPTGESVAAVDFLSSMNTDRTAELNMWYHVLNTGFRTRLSGETDFPCITGERVGIGRVYARVDGDLDFDRWCDSIRDGRSYVSDGRTHLMNFRAGVGTPKLECGTLESTIETPGPETIVFEVLAASLSPDVKKDSSCRVELVVNGYPVAQQDTVADGKERLLRFEHRIEKSAWAAIRVFPSAHTNPVFIEVDNKPIRANKYSALWCLRSLEQCWRSKSPTYQASEQAQAKMDYDQARAVFEKRLSEAISN